jgi:hypothetical protein
MTHLPDLPDSAYPPDATPLDGPRLARGNGLGRGLMIGVPLALLLWALLGFGVVEIIQRAAR